LLPTIVTLVPPVLGPIAGVIVVTTGLSTTLIRCGWAARPW